MGLFTGFSVISGIELLYWIIFKVMFFAKISVAQLLCGAGVLPQEGHRLLRGWWGWQERPRLERAAISKWGDGGIRGSLLQRNAINWPNAKVSSGKEDVEAGGVKVAETSCCKSCKALASNVKLDAMEAEIAELKKAMKVKAGGRNINEVFSSSQITFHPKYIITSTKLVISDALAVQKKLFIHAL